ncbi:MAG: hypothetical protein ACR2IP_08880 [Solirubrobacteraceae bacterium]
MLDGIRANEIIIGAYGDDDGGVCPMLAAHRNGPRTHFSAFAKAWDSFGRRSASTRHARPASDRELLILTTHLETSLMDEDGPDPDLAAAMAEHRMLVARREQGLDTRADEPTPAPRQPTLAPREPAVDPRELLLPRDQPLTPVRKPTLAPASEPTLASASEPVLAPRRQEPAAPRVRPGEPDRTHELRDEPGWAWMRPFRRYDEYERALEYVQSQSAFEALRQDTDPEAPRKDRERELVR